MYSLAKIELLNKDLVMDYGGYVFIGILVMAGVFFSVALFYRAEPRTLKFTAFGFITLSVAGLALLSFESSLILKVSVCAFFVLAILAYWFYGGAMKDGRSSN